MKKGFIKFKIPTLLGLGIIIGGIIATSFLTLKEQVLLSRASPDVTAQNITISNISDTEVSISYQTSQPVISFVSFGQSNPDEQTAIDDKDQAQQIRPTARSIHYITIKNLLPKTTYQYRVTSGKVSSDIRKFTTAIPLNQQSAFRPIIGFVLDGDKPLEEGIAYLSIADASTQSAQVKSGNFLIPISQIRKSDLSDSFPLSDDTTIKLTIVSDKGNANAQFKLVSSNKILPPLKIGQDIDLASETVIEPSPPAAGELIIYDLNGDGKINAADNAIVLQDYGKKGKGIKGDLNKDGQVNQKDLDLTAKQINQ
ncbi:fibronectin type III domain-containing protein [Candidatus Roizmanbacteria bacterium]|nr:fibronectin type III domain-containing protein [Candidatus Roizmanbacteria bacterium]